MMRRRGGDAPRRLSPEALSTSSAAAASAILGASTDSRLHQSMTMAHDVSCSGRHQRAIHAVLLRFAAGRILRRRQKPATPSAGVSSRRRNEFIYSTTLSSLIGNATSASGNSMLRRSLFRYRVPIYYRRSPVVLQNLLMLAGGHLPAEEPRR